MTIGSKISARSIVNAITGVIVFLGALAIWSGLLGTPWELKPYAVTLDSELRAVRPWAPWWLMPSLTALIGMGLWRTLAQRRGRKVSYFGAAVTCCLMPPIGMAIATVCLEMGAILQYSPLPSIGRIISLVPAILLESLGFAAIMMLFHGIVLVPLTVIVGILIAAISRLALRRQPVNDSLPQSRQRLTAA